MPTKADEAKGLTEKIINYRPVMLVTCDTAPEFEEALNHYEEKDYVLESWNYLPGWGKIAAVFRKRVELPEMSETIGGLAAGLGPKVSLAPTPLEEAVSNAEPKGLKETGGDPTPSINKPKKK